VSPLADDRIRKSVRITLTGQVQGVGFRPFVYRIAVEHGLVGHVLNKVGEVDVLVAGNEDSLNQFIDELVSKAPPLARPVLQSIAPAQPPEVTEFRIAPSSAKADARIFVPPDYFMCDDCGHELENPDDRRFRYPFINCTQCGPRYTLIRELPYDRPNTSMNGFPLCAACQEEYDDPADRRFHAEPVACPECGPEITYCATGGGDLRGEAALEAALDDLRNGRIVAVKGVGGYHLMCSASDEAAVARLRQRKHRPGKPLAVMFPVEETDGLAAVNRAVWLSSEEAELLSGPVRPILLAKKKDVSTLARNLAPGLAELGVFLPYTPLHQLLLSGFDGPLVATSGNISGEPVLIDNDEATARLSTIADAFLHHDRPILRPADDPVFRSIAGLPRPLRIGRGVAPQELRLPCKLERPVLAVGGHMKGTVAIGWGDRAVVSPHIGEMDSPRSMAVFESVVADLQELYGVTVEQIVADGHPGYATHRWARAQDDLPVSTVWHHAAHASALAGEYSVSGQWLVFTWDGVGLGPDDNLWGGETLLGRPGNWQRMGSMRSFRLPGGERAGREPWRSAASLHWECNKAWSESPDADGLLYDAWSRGINAPQTSAAGRLFDGASALVCGTHSVSFEAEGPMRLEALCRNEGEAIPLPIMNGEDGLLVIDWEPLVTSLPSSRG
jgi:hydrogenase maturation protein HypF